MAFTQDLQLLMQLDLQPKEYLLSLHLPSAIEYRLWLLSKMFGLAHSKIARA